MTKTYKVNMITVDGRTVPIAHRVFESRRSANAYAQQLIESSGYRSSEIVENTEPLKAAVEFQMPDGDDAGAQREIHVIEIPALDAPRSSTPGYIQTQIRNSAQAKKMLGQGARIRGTLVTWHGDLSSAIRELEQKLSNTDLMSSYKTEFQSRLSKLKMVQAKTANAAVNEAITAVSMATAKRKIQDGEWEAMEDLKPGKHVEMRVTKSNKRKTYLIKEDIATDAINMEHDHEVQMARGQLYHAARDAMRLHKILKSISEEEGLEGWVAAKITRAADYLNSVADYMEYEHVSGNVGADVPSHASIVLQGMQETTAAGGVAAVVMPLGQPRKRTAAKKR